MRKTITALLAAAALASVAAQPAAADVPSTVERTTSSARCTTGWQYGVYAAYGAWGDYIDGCTVSWTCPAAWNYCEVLGRSTIETLEETGNRVTLNQRVRSPYGHMDASCEGFDRCVASSGIAGVCPACGSHDFILGGQKATVQCNGVRDEDIPDREQTLARVRCQLYGWKKVG